MHLFIYLQKRDNHKSEITTQQQFIQEERRKTLDRLKQYKMVGGIYHICVLNVYLAASALWNS